jgi:N-acetylneuraminate epimerase
MKNRTHTLFLLLMLTTMAHTACTQAQRTPALHWGQAPLIPDSTGFAGSFAGVSNGSLLVAGGANFPGGGAPWTGATKKWHDKIYVLEEPEGPWKEAGRLPRALGYGVSVSWRDALVCVGGSNEGGHYADAFLVRYEGGRTVIQNLPSLPQPIANTCGVVIGDVVYVAGGTVTPDSKTCGNNFWALDLSKGGAEQAWQELPSWPGPSRMLAVAGTLDGAFYLFSGAELVEGQRRYLRDAYRYTPAQGWRRIADLPAPVVAAPSPAYASSGGRLLVFGGDNGELASRSAQLKEQHPGFSADVLAYDPASNQWVTTGTIPTHRKDDAVTHPNGSVWAPVTTTLVVWNGRVVLPGGEVRPATRTPRVLTASINIP